MNNANRTRRPATSEYDSYYAGYINRVPDGDIIAGLADQMISTLKLLGNIPAQMEDYRYAEGKWSIKELIGHIVDTEWVFAYRGLSFARGDAGPLPGIDQDEYMAGADFSGRPLSSLVSEYKHLRQAVISLFGSFNESVMDRTGTASGCPFTVRSIAYIIAGHENHHLEVLIKEYLKE